MITLNFSGNRINDPIFGALVSAGANSADLNNYLSASDGSVVQLTTSNSLAFHQSVRTAFLNTLAGAYRINGTDAKMDSANTSNSANQTSVASVTSGGAVENGILTANSMPILLSAYIGNVANGTQGQLRRSTATANTTGNLISGTPTQSFTAVATPVINVNFGAAGYYLFVIKRPSPSLADTADRNVMFGNTFGIGLNAGNSYICNTNWTCTVPNMANAFHRMWQAIAVPTSSY